MSVKANARKRERDGPKGEEKSGSDIRSSRYNRKSLGRAGSKREGEGPTPITFGGDGKIVL